MKFLVPAFLFLLLLVVIIIVRKSARAKSSGSVGLLVNPAENDNGAVDINLSIDHKTKLDSSTVYDLKATYKNKLVGFKIEIPDKDKQNERGFGNGITIKTLGKQSDDFRNALSDIYGLDTSVKKFPEKVNVSYVDLHQFAKSYTKKSIENSPYSTELKLLFQSDKGDQAELYLNIRNDEKVIEFAEKDEEYRKPLVEFLTQQ
ncbi:hypothetical protein [Mucilaginibacter kameinonensis]|uniref:hypothetical protein n=1 Tax=Mucilaginibacter kameinonensis TaxID=452286 RepID=UPI000EF79806|nr:hypothetical protein [Mucilaginibacter kameinonensis]